MLLLRCNAPLRIVVDVVDIKIVTSVPHQLYESCSEQDLGRHAQDKYADLPSGNLLNAFIESGCIRYSGCIHGMDGQPGIADPEGLSRKQSLVECRRLRVRLSL